MNFFWSLFVFNFSFAEEPASQSISPPPPPYLIAQAEEDTNLIDQIKKHFVFRKSYSAQVNPPASKDPKAEHMLQNEEVDQVNHFLPVKAPFMPEASFSMGVYNSGLGEEKRGISAVPMSPMSKDPLPMPMMKASPPLSFDVSQSPASFMPFVEDTSNPPEPKDPKAEQMAKCFSDMHEVLTDQEKRRLVVKGSKLINIMCDHSDYSARSYIWDEEYPTAFCYDITDRSFLQPRGRGSSIRKTPYSEEEKDKKLKDCLQALSLLRGDSDLPSLPETNGKR